MFKRIGLFVLTNIAIMAMISIILFVLSSVFGVNLSGYNTSIGGLLAYSAVIGFTGSFVSLAISRWMAKRSYDIQLIDEKNLHQYHEKEQFVYKIVHRIAQMEHITTPEVGVYQSEEANAFATGPSKNKALVAVSSGLLDAMDKDEIEGVVAHEMAHILNGDMVTMTLMQGVVNTFVVFLSRLIAGAIDRALAGNNNEEESSGPSMTYFIASIILDIIFGLLAQIVLMAFSRHREYRADAGSAKYVGKNKMIKALERLKEITEKNHVEPNEKEPMAAFKISGGHAMMEMLMSHPPLEKRIQALK
ncbi:MAG: protease HtpX [Candidatus Gracilibacteria bacterium]